MSQYDGYIALSFALACLFSYRFLNIFLNERFLNQNPLIILYIWSALYPLSIAFAISAIRQSKNKNRVLGIITLFLALPLFLVSPFGSLQD
jgi:hypothetical protein